MSTTTVTARVTTSFWPMLGIIFLPETTLFYVFLWSPGVGLQGWDWLWIGLAFAMDVSNLAGNIRANRDSIPGMASKPAVA